MRALRQAQGERRWMVRQRCGRRMLARPPHPVRAELVEALARFVQALRQAQGERRWLVRQQRCRRMLARPPHPVRAELVEAPSASEPVPGCAPSLQRSTPPSSLGSTLSPATPPPAPLHGSLSPGTTPVPPAAVAACSPRFRPPDGRRPDAPVRRCARRSTNRRSSAACRRKTASRQPARGFDRLSPNGIGGSLAAHFSHPLFS